MARGQFRSGVACVVLAGLILLPRSPAVLGEDEPENDGYQQAESLGLLGGEEIGVGARRIWPVGDEDWFRFDLAQPARVAMYTEAMSRQGTVLAGDTVLELLDDGAPPSAIAADDDRGGWEFSSLVRELAAGTYHLRVTGGDALPVPSYDLKVRKFTPASRPYARAEGIDLAGGTAITDRADIDRDQVQWHFFDVPPAAAPEAFSTVTVAATADVRISAYRGSRRNLVATAGPDYDDRGHFLPLALHRLTPGDRYYLKVTPPRVGRRRFVPASYRLHLSTDRAAFDPPASSNPEIFHDRFETADAWEPLAGTWGIARGGYQTRTTALAYACVADAAPEVPVAGIGAWDGVVLSSEVRLLSGKRAEGGFYFTFGDAAAGSHGYAVLRRLRTGLGVLVVGENDGTTPLETRIKVSRQTVRFGRRNALTLVFRKGLAGGDAAPRAAIYLGGAFKGERTFVQPGHERLGERVGLCARRGKVRFDDYRISLLDYLLPVAADDTAVTAEDTPVAVPVLGNDDLDGDPLSLVSFTDGAHGTTSDGGGGRIAYHPEENWHGGDVFEYAVRDGKGWEGTAQVRVTVAPVNDAPVADAGDDATAFVGDTVVLDGGGSSDVESSPLGYDWSFSALPTGSGAALADPDTVSPSFVPDLPGDYLVRLVVSDGTEDSAPDTVTVSASPRPVTVPDVVGLAQGEAEAAIAAAGLTVGLVGTAHSDTVTAGDVISQAPPAGSGVPPGAAVDIVVSLGPVELPPDPGEVAPPIDETVATNLHDATEFLYIGESPIQTGVPPGTIEPVRVAVLRGRVRSRGGDPLPGVTVAVLGHPEYGRTLTRADGMFDLAVNGGGHLVVDYRKEGHLPVQRQVVVPWQDYTWLPEVVMIGLDPAVTVLDLASPAPFQVAAGGVVTDDDGTRQAVLAIPEGTTAEIFLPDGTPQAVSTLSLRATEYTVGEDGPAAMPAELPPTTGYTYAVELSADEALAGGVKVNGRDVVFSQPVSFYVDNFLGFPVGIAVPTGYYDGDRGAWVPVDNGRVIGVVGVTGGSADLDVDGDGAADTGTALADLGVTDAERVQLAALYGPGQSLWRVRLGHLSTWDCNWGIAPPPDAEQPPAQDPRPDRLDDTCEETSSIIECQNQLLGERLPVTGTPYTLNYRSDRVPGFLAPYSMEVQLSGGDVPESLESIVLEVRVAGRMFTERFPPAAGQTHAFTWDGLDAYGRRPRSPQSARMRLGYTYGGVYGSSPRFGYNGNGIPITGSRARQEITLWREWEDALGSWDVRGIGLGGWSLDAHHLYSPAERVLYLGDGSRRSAAWLGKTIRTVAGTGVRGDNSLDGGPAVETELSDPRGVAAGPDGSFYFAERNDNKISRVDPEGVIHRFAGSRLFGGFWGDGGPATDAGLYVPHDVAVGPDGSVYIADTGNHSIRRVGPDGIIDTVAGSGGYLSYGFGGDGGPATEALLNSPQGVAVAPDGTFYIADTNNYRIRRVGPDGTISTLAGTDSWCSPYTDPCGDGGPATEGLLNSPVGLAVGPDGSVYVADSGRIRRISPEGIITTVAGTGGSCYTAPPGCGDGGPATEARFALPVGLAVTGDGAIHVADQYGNRIRRIDPAGIISTVTGTRLWCEMAIESCGDGGPAAQGRLWAPYDVAVGEGGDLYIVELANYAVRRVSPLLPGFTEGDFGVPSADGAELHHFDPRGRHLRTLSTLTGAVLRTFSYDAEGRLEEVVDGYGNTTSIERDPEGLPTAIVAPGGQRTALTLNPEGYLDSVANPAGESTAFGYAAGGLLTAFTGPGGATTVYEHDAAGRLTRSEDAAGGFKELARTDDANGFTVTKTTALGRVTAYRTEYLPLGEVRSLVTRPDGSWIEVRASADGTDRVTGPDGTVVSLRYGPDPRFGMLAPIIDRYSVEYPGGGVATLTQSRTVTMADPADPFTLQAIEDTSTVNGRISRINYDAASRTRTVTTPAGRQTVSTIDEHGRVTGISLAPSVEPISLTYDPEGRLHTAAQGAQSWAYGYDEANRVVSQVDAMGNETSYGYDNADRLIRAQTPGGAVEGYGYDLDGNMTQVVMPSGARHALAYSPRSALTGYLPPSSPGYRYEYDQDRAVSSTTLPGGRVIANSFDTAGRWTGVSYPGAEVSFSYAPCCGHLESLLRTPASGPSQHVTFRYEDTRLTGMTWSGVADGDFNYAYDENLFLREISLVSGSDSFAASLTLDDDGMATDYGPFALTRGGPGGAVSEVSDGTLTMTLDYDALARVRNRSYTVDGVPTYSCVLTRDSAGRIAQKVETTAGVSHTYDYTYDADSRLTEVVRDATLTVERYTYDANGNRLSTLGAGATYDAQDRLVALGGTSYTFDDDGFLAERGTDTFSYSARGELLRVTQGPDTITYHYDGLGRMVGREDADGMRQYLYGNPAHPFQVTATRDPAGALTVFYHDETGSLLAFERGGSRFYVATDQVGSPRVVADAGGAVLKVLEYDGFGRRLSDSNPAFDLPIGFAGGLEDTVTGLVRFGYRDYDQEAGRWTARDPVLYGGGQANLYVYVGNEPVGLKDPLGLWCLNASMYRLLGGGMQLCCSGLSLHCSVCAEVGFGAGASLEIGDGEPKPTGHTGVVKLTADCFGFGPVVECRLDKCSNECSGGMSLGPVEVTSGGVSANSAWSTPTRCGYEGKLAAEDCLNLDNPSPPRRPRLVSPLGF